MPKERNSEVKISGAYIMKGNTADLTKEPAAAHGLVSVGTTANSLTISVKSGRESDVPLIGHRISMKGMDIADEDGELFDVKWYEKSNVAYNALPANKWTDLYSSNYDALLFSGLGDSIEDFPLAVAGSNRTLEFAVLAKMNTGNSFFMNATQVTGANISTFTINHCGIVSAANAETLRAYLGFTLNGSSAPFALPGAVTIANCSKEFSDKNVYRCKYE